MRSISTLLATLLIVLITVASLITAYIVISAYIKAKQPRGEIIDMFLVARKTPATAGGVGTIKASLFISCSGPNCEEYLLEDVTLVGYDRESGDQYLLARLMTGIFLKKGITRVDLVGFYPPDRNINEVVATAYVCPPNTPTCDIYYKSVTVG